MTEAERKTIRDGVWSQYHLACIKERLKMLSDKQFLANSKRHDQHGHIYFHEWQILPHVWPGLWQAEYDRRFLLRPAAFAPDDRHLVRAI